MFYLYIKVGESMKNIKNKKNKGFTLVEILLVVGFIALASIGIYAVYNKVQSGAKANKTLQDIQTLRAGIKNLYGGKKDFSTITAAVVRDARIAPSDMVVGGGPSGTELRNVFGGIVNIIPATLTGAQANSAFSIVMPQIPGDVCSKLVSTTGPYFDEIRVGATLVKSSNATNVPVDGATTANACAGDTLTLTFSSF